VGKVRWGEGGRGGEGGVGGRGKGVLAGEGGVGGRRKGDSGGGGRHVSEHIWYTDIGTKQHPSIFSRVHFDGWKSETTGSFY